MRPALVTPEPEQLFLEIKKVLRGPCGVSEPVTLKSRLVEDLALDSVGFLALALGLENRFRIRLEEDPEHPPETVKDVVNLLQQRLNTARPEVSS